MVCPEYRSKEQNQPSGATPGIACRLSTPGHPGSPDSGLEADYPLLGGPLFPDTFIMISSQTGKIRMNMTKGMQLAVVRRWEREKALGRYVTSALGWADGTYCP